MTCWTIFFANASGCSRASATVAGSSGQPGATVVKPLSSKKSRHGCQLLDSSHSPCTKSTGVRSEALARSISARSQSASVEPAVSLIVDPFDVGRSLRGPGSGYASPGASSPDSKSRCNAVFTSTEFVPRSRVT